MAADLFIIEGDGPSPCAAAYGSGAWLCLLDTGTGPAQRAGVRAVAASFGEVEELVLLNSDAEYRSAGNDDVLEELPARHRRHLRPGGAGPDADPALRVPVEGYQTLGGSGSVAIGSQVWPGWELGSVGVLRVDPSRQGRVAFHLASCQALIVPNLLVSTEQSGGGGLPSVMASGMLQLINGGDVQVVSVGSGAPITAAECRHRLTAMVAAAPTRRSLPE